MSLKAPWRISVVEPGTHARVVRHSGALPLYHVPWNSFEAPINLYSKYLDTLEDISYPTLLSYPKLRYHLLLLPTTFYFNNFIKTQPD